MNQSAATTCASGSGCRSGPSPYHIFQCLDERFVYITASGQFLRIDAPTYDFLEICRNSEPDIAKKVLLHRGTYPPAMVEDVAREISILTDHGLFEVPDWSLTEEDFEKQLEQRYASSWNKLELALSETCNLACRYCYCSTCRDTPNQGLMSETIARQAINWLFAASGRANTVNITFFGGEPLTNKPVLKFAIEYSQQLGNRHGKKVFYSMTTNGTLLDDEIISYIKKYNFGLMVSLDGPPEIHNPQCPTRNGQGSFDAAVAGIRKLMARRRTVTVRCTMTHPVPRMLDLIHFFEGFGFTRAVLGCTVNPVNPSPVDFTAQDFAECERQELEEVIPWILKKLAAGERPIYFPYERFISEQQDSKPTARPNTFRCGACRGTTTVGADGTLYPCHRFVGMKSWTIGTIQNGPDYDRCKQFWREYRSSTQDKCASCWLWSKCHGPCPWEIAAADGSFQKPHRYCDLIKKHAQVGAYVCLKKNQIASKGIAHDTRK